jgi:uncharacterized Ntn-hydrolase superfamily protein
VGSAGASCIDNISCGGCGGVVIISDVHPGRGVIHTQASWLAANQNNARNQMNLGLSPQQIINWLQANDAQGNPTIRQYGIVDFDSTGKPRSAAFTGVNCFDYKNHITGPNYSIQGNILLGQQILDSMQSRFLNTQGDLACKLMASLQGAKVIGADTRCTNSGNSSLSSFLRVAKPTDTIPNYYLNLVVKSGPAGYEPIDSLQTLFNAVHSCNTGIAESPKQNFSVIVQPNPARDKVNIILSEVSEKNFSFELFNVLGQKVFSSEIKNTGEIFIDISSLATGIYYYKIILKGGRIVSGKFQKD